MSPINALWTSNNEGVSITINRDCEGIILYCVKHGQGALVTENDYTNINFDSLSSTMCSQHSLCRDYWEPHGNFQIVDGQLVLDGKPQTYYDDICDGWKLEYFKNSIYDQGIEKTLH